MKRIAKKRRKAKEVFENVCGQEWMNEEFAKVMETLTLTQKTVLRHIALLLINPLRKSSNWGSHSTRPYDPSYGFAWALLHLIHPSLLERKYPFFKTSAFILSMLFFYQIGDSI